MKHRLPPGGRRAVRWLPPPSEGHATALPLSDEELAAGGFSLLCGRTVPPVPREFIEVRFGRLVHIEEATAVTCQACLHRLNRCLNRGCENEPDEEDGDGLCSFCRPDVTVSPLHTPKFAGERERRINPTTQTLVVLLNAQVASMP